MSDRAAALLLERGLAGVPPLSSAVELAEEFRRDRRYADADQRVAALIRSEAAKNFSTGFLTGLGGAVVLPVAMPAAIAASWLLQARMAGAIASLYGHDLDSPRVRETLQRCLAGEVGRQALEALLPAGRETPARGTLEWLPGRALIEVNKRLGLRLLGGGFGSRVLGLSRLLPLLGGIVGGTYDATVCRAVGRAAQSLLQPVPPAAPAAKRARPRKAATRGSGSRGSRGSPRRPA